jgi:Cupin
VKVRELPVSKTMAGVNMRLTDGGVRELHWHTADEWVIVLYGTARITAVDRDGKSFVADVKKNDLWYFPSGIPQPAYSLMCVWPFRRSGISPCLSAPTRSSIEGATFLESLNNPSKDR